MLFRPPVERRVIITVVSGRVFFLTVSVMAHRSSASNLTYNKLQLGTTVDIKEEH
jgi:hypothetical protein